MKSQILHVTTYANFKEVILKLRYQPFHKLVFDGRLLLMNYGEDTGTENWGSNVLTTHLTRINDFNNEMMIKCFEKIVKKRRKRRKSKKPNRSPFEKATTLNRYLLIGNQWNYTLTHKPKNSLQITHRIVT